MNETEVYLRSKKLLIRLGWTLLGGQPPSGCDHLPVIEIKDPQCTAKGSRGAYKPDLVALRQSTLLLVECKPDHHEGDVAKLQGVLDSEERKKALLDEILQRGLLRRHSIKTPANELLRNVEGAIAHAGHLVEVAGLGVIYIGDQADEDRFIEPRVG